MKVRMKVQITGTRDGVAWPPKGETRDVPDAEGADLCAAGLAEPVKSGPTVERAVPAAPEPGPTPEPEQPKAKPARKTTARKPRAR